MKKIYESPELELNRFVFSKLMSEVLDPSDPQSGVDGGDPGVGGDPFG